MKYTVVIEKAGNGYSAYVPDVPGCVAAADTREETEELIREAIVYHLEVLRESGDPIPEPEPPPASSRCSGLGSYFKGAGRFGGRSSSIP